METRPGYMALVHRDDEQRSTDLKEAQDLARRCMKRLAETLDNRQDLTIEELSDLAHALRSCVEVLKS